MPGNVCSLTGQIIKEGAVSRKTGHLFEKQAIMKHLSSFPYCPISNQPMGIEDLVFVQDNKQQMTRAQQSASTFLNSLKEEYDTLVLQRFYIRKSIKQTKEQLSHSLTANQASERVIGRLLKEREEMDREVQKLKLQVA